MTKAEVPGKSESTARYLTYAQVAAKYEVKLPTLYSWVSRRQIPFTRIGPRVVRFREDQLDAWISSRTFQPNPE